MNTLGEDFNIEDTDQFKLDVLKEVTNPEINVANEELYDRIVFILKNEFKDVPAGEIMDTFKLLVFEIVGGGMKEEHEYYAEKHREALK